MCVCACVCVWGWSLFRKSNSNLKRSQGPKTLKRRFSKNPIKRPGICRSRFKICKHLGTFIRTSRKVVGYNLQKWLVTFSKKTQFLKDLKVQKHQKTAFRRIRLNVPGFVDPVIRSARISGRLFVRLKIGYLHLFDQKLKIEKSKD